MKIDLEYIGTYNAKTSFNSIIWCINALHKTRSKRAKTKYLLDIYEKYFNDLVKNECFELLQYLSDNLTNKQIENRFKWRNKQQIEHIEYMANLEAWKSKRDAQKRLLTIDLN